MKKLIFILVISFACNNLYSQRGFWVKGGISPQTALVGIELSNRNNHSISGLNFGLAKNKAPYSDVTKTVVGMGWSQYVDLAGNDPIYFQLYGALCLTINNSVHQEYSSIAGSSNPDWGHMTTFILGLRLQLKFFDFKLGGGIGYDSILDYHFVPEVSIGLRLFQY